jgi:hypothetical protein
MNDVSATASLLELQPGIVNAMSYQEFYDLVEQLADEGKTSGPVQSEALIFYTSLNRQRMKRINKQFKLRDDLAELAAAIKKPQQWYVLAEAWCGDVPANLPVLAAVAEASENIEFKVVLRDENLDLMNNFLTNGRMSIPKLAAFDKESGDAVLSWGPRPKPAQKLVTDYKAIPKEEREPYLEFVQKVQKWYVEDKWETIQDELMELLKPFT